MHIFYCAGGKIGEVAGVSPDAGPQAPDAVLVRPVCSLSGSARVRHRTPGTGRQVGASSVLSPVSSRFALLPRFKSVVRCSVSGDLARLQTSLCLRPVCTGHVRCQLDYVRCSAGDRWSSTCEIQKVTRGCFWSTRRRG